MGGIASTLCDQWSTTLKIVHYSVEPLTQLRPIHVTMTELNFSLLNQITF